MHKNVEGALKILEQLGFPRAQLNERSALTLLALLNLGPEKNWNNAQNPLMGITPIMDWSYENYGKRYAPNSRETFRRFTMHQFVQAGIAQYNPDNEKRPVNSPNAVYQIDRLTLSLLQTYGTRDWELTLTAYTSNRKSLSEIYAKRRLLNRVPLKVGRRKKANLSPGAHSELIKAVVEEFGPRFVPGGNLVYVGDTGEKFAHLDEKLLSKLGVKIDSHGKMPDVVIYFSKRNWLILAEAVTSHGPVDGKRHRELKELFSASSAGLVFITAFPTKKILTRYIAEISWETEVWVADNPDHLIHFNGERFLGPYEN